MLNLNPYNWYFFYGSLILLVIFLILTAIKALSLLKSASPLMEKAKTLQEKQTALTEKSAQAKEILGSLKKTLTSLSYGYLILKAAKRIYDNDDSMHGLKGRSKSTIQAIQEERLAEKTFKRYQKKFN